MPTSKKAPARKAGKKALKKSTPAKSSPVAQEQRLAGARIPIQFLVDYKSDGNYLFDFCKDLGEGGIFLTTEKPKEPGSELELTFTIPDNPHALRAKGRVIWTQPVVPARPDLTPGMGVQFESFSKEDRTRLVEYVRRYANKIQAA